MEHPLLGRYLAGECSEAQAAAVREWIAASPENLRAFRAFEAVWRASPTEAAWDAEAAWTKLDRTLEDRPRLMLEPTVAGRSFALGTRGRWMVAARVAAVLALVVAGGIAGQKLFSHRGQAPVDVATRTVTAPRGQRATLRLPDGTSVMLGAASRLRYREAFDAGPREVSLEGEAYFEVRHDERRPFVVRAGDLVAKDLGTEFVVRAYPEDAHAWVVVRAGKVAVRGAAAIDTASGPVLLPGQLGRLGPNGESVIESADTATSFAWTRGQLVLAGTPLPEAVAEIGRWYDVDVHLASPELSALRLTASFGDEPVSEVMRLIAASLRLKLSHADRAYTLTAN